MKRGEEVIFWEKVIEEHLQLELFPRPKGKNTKFITVARKAIVKKESESFCKVCGRLEENHVRKGSIQIKHKYEIDKEEIFLDLEVDLPIGPGRTKAPIKALISRVKKGEDFNQWALTN